ncbi:MAG TPA: hypothetical protein VHA56_03645 [Mucilaginibacter sp.]|nr:hypothetical protein [Mucilaginibacter sp.]
MNPRAIDYITEDFYESISFQDGELPDLETVRELFHGGGQLINNSFGRPVIYSIDTFTEMIEAQIAGGEMKQFMQRELYSKTDVFGKVAQRVSVYEYSLADHKMEHLPRGINYIQYVLIDDNWRIAAMAWADENENHQIPQEYLE